MVSDIEECAMVVDTHAHVFKKSDVADLKKKLRELLENSELVNEYKSNAMDYICDKYNWEIVVKNTLQLYKNEIY